MKKLPAALLAGAALAASALALLTAWPRPPREAPPRAAGGCDGTGPLAAGAAERPFALPAALSIAGFPRLRWAAEGHRDPVAARALVVGAPGCAVGLVSLELLLVPEPLERAIAARAAPLGLGALVVAATHTHAGPGGFWDSTLGGRIGAGPFDPAVFAAVVDAAGQALEAAAAARRPARLTTARGAAADLSANRNGGADEGRLVSLRLEGTDGAPIGAVALFNAHATILGQRNARISGDWPGALMRASPVPLLFFMGALGDVTTDGPAGATDTPESYGAAVGARLHALPRDAPAATARVAAARVVATLPPTSPGALPELLRPAAGRLLSGVLPGEAPATALRLGPVLLLASPGEPTEAVGRAWRAAAGPDAEVLSLADGYAGYVEAPEVMASGGGETVRTYFGPALAARLEAALRAAAERVR